MKKTLLVLGGIALLFLLLVIRLFVVEHTVTKEEQEWFVRELRYEFSAVVDSVKLYNNGVSGNIRGRIIAGDPNTKREDSLKKSFKKHDQIYLVYKRSGDSIRFILPYANQIRKGDSIRLSSNENTIRVFREGKQVVNQPMHESLTAYQKPPFVN